MRIVFIGPGFRLKHRYFYYSFYKNLLLGFQRSSHSIFFISDRDEADNFLFGIRSLGKNYVNRMVMELCENVKPNLVISCHSDLINTETFKIIKEKHQCVIALVDCDPIDFDDQKSSIRRLRRLNSVVDAAFYTTGGKRISAARKIFERTFFVPNPLDESLFSKRCNPERPIDVGYVSNGRGENSPQLSFLKKSGFSVELRGGKNKKSIYGYDFEKFMCSLKSSIVYSNYDDDLYSSDRISQIFAAEAVALIPKSIGMQAYIREDEALFFDSSEELSKKMVNMIGDGKWREIGPRGRKAYLRHFNSRDVADYIIKKSMSPEVMLGSFDQH